MHYTEDGLPVYDCNICHDQGRVYPRDPETGKPDYSKVVMCRCRREPVQTEEKQGKLSQ